MGYHRQPSPKPWLVVRRKGNGLVHTVPSERYRTKKRAEKEAKIFNRACKGSGVKFMVRKEGWRRKKGYS